MTEDTRHEALSALMDDELPSARATRALDTLTRDEQLRERWARYHLIGAAIRGEPLAPDDLSSRVSQALDREPVQLPPPRRQRTSVKPLTGFAIAASVAAVAVVALRLFLGAESELPNAVPVALNAGLAAPQTLAVAPTTTPAPAAAAAPTESAKDAVASAPLNPGPALRMVSGHEPEVVGGLQLSRADLKPGVEARLNHYLVNHTESLNTGMRGMFPYVALVGYEPSR